MKSTFYKEEETRKKLAEFVSGKSFLSLGEQCFEFEKKFAESQGKKYATLFNSGGSANLAILQTLKNLGYLKDGDKVGFSAITWSTNIMPIIQLGLQPISIDVQPTTLNTMSWQLETALKSNSIKVFFITNALGFCGDLDKIKKICNNAGIILLEDNCESLGTKTKSGLTGSFGLAATFSFYVAHHLSTVEGGMVCTDSIEVSDMLKIVRSNGWGRNLPEAKREYLIKLHNISPAQERYSFYDLGYNFKPTEITGFLGLQQLPYLHEIITLREKIYKSFESIIKKNEDFIPTYSKNLSVISCFAIPVICTCPEIKDKYLKKFSDAQVETRPVITGNIQRQPFYKKYVKDDTKLTGSEFIHDCGFYFGNCPDYTPEELEIMKGCLE